MTTCQFCSNPADPCYGRESTMCGNLVCWGKRTEARQALNAEAAKDERVVAVRADAAVGHGTCSSIDECYEDVELLEALNERGCKTCAESVQWAREVDGLHWESGLNQMSGEPETDNPIREMHAESVARNKLPIEC